MQFKVGDNVYLNGVRRGECGEHRYGTNDVMERWESFNSMLVVSEITYNEVEVEGEGSQSYSVHPDEISHWPPPESATGDAHTSDGSTASYYELPDGATQLQDLISHRDMNAQIGEIFRACYRYGLASHSRKLRDAKKILFYAQAEVERLELYGEDDA